jgi:hypothetical protein
MTWWSNLVNGAISAVVGFVRNVLGAVFVWLRDTIIMPVVNGITRAVQWFAGIAVGVFTTVVNFVRTVFGAVFTWLHDTIIAPVFGAISRAISFYWGQARIMLAGGVVFVRTVFGAVWTWLHDRVIAPVWNGIKATISNVWNGGIKPVFDTIKTAVTDTLPKAFKTAATAIGTAWSAVKSVVKAPIRFVVETVINDALIGNFNKVAVALEGKGAKKITPISLPKGFAGGGIIPGYQSQKRDDVMMPMRRGEGVLVPEVVRALGAGTIHALNRAGNRGGVNAVKGHVGLATGGIVGAAQGALHWAQDAVGTAQGVITDPVGTIGRVVNSVIGRIPGAGVILPAVSGMASKLLAATIGQLKAIADPIGKAGAGIASFFQGAAIGNGKNGQVNPATLTRIPNFHPGAGVGPYGGYLRSDAARAYMSADTAFNHATGGHLSLTEGYRDLASQRMRYAAFKSGRGNLAAVPGTSTHGFATAADIGAGGQAWLDRNGPSFGWYPTGLGFSQREPWHFDYKRKTAVAGQALGGVVPTLFDGGGVIPQGISVIQNKTKKPEYAIPEPKLEAIVQNAGGRGDAPLVGSLTLESHGNVNDDLREVKSALRDIKRGGPTR